MTTMQVMEGDVKHAANEAGLCLDSGVPRAGTFRAARLLAIAAAFLPMGVTHVAPAGAGTLSFVTCDAVSNGAVFHEEDRRMNETFLSACSGPDDSRIETLALAYADSSTLRGLAFAEVVTTDPGAYSGIARGTATFNDRVANARGQIPSGAYYQGTGWVQIWSEVSGIIEQTQAGFGSAFGSVLYTLSGSSSVGSDFCLLQATGLCLLEFPIFFGGQEGLGTFDFSQSLSVEAQAGVGNVFVGGVLREKRAKSDFTNTAVLTQVVLLDALRQPLLNPEIVGSSDFDYGSLGAAPAVPEPAALVLIGTGAAGLLVRLRRRKVRRSIA